MKRVKKIFYVISIIILIAILLTLLSGCSNSDFKTDKREEYKNTTDYTETAILKLPDGRIVRGAFYEYCPITSSTLIRICIDGVTYTTGPDNICIINESKK